MTAVPRDRRLVVLWCAAVAAAVTGLALMAWHWAGGLPYDAVGGTWTALADDLAHGDFYRPLHGELGYGGTRYMPFFFALHGGLIHAGLPAGAAGLALTIGSMLLLEAGAFRWMRQQGVRAGIALPCVLLMHASIAYQLLSISTKGDLLAAGLSLWGLNFVVTGVRGASRPALVLAALLFAAAGFTKFTECFGLAAAVLWLAGSGRRATALRLLALTAVFALVGLAVAQGLSGGRMGEVLAACATGGGRWDYAWKFPVWFARAAVQDPFFLVLVVFAAVAAVGRWSRDIRGLPAIYFAVTALGTLPLFVSPGTDSNHFADLLVAAVGLTGLALDDPATRRGAARVVGALGCGCVLTWVPGVPSVRHFLTASGRPTVAGIAELGRRLGPAGAQRILAENPVVPLELGRRPEIVDSFNLRLVAARFPEMGGRFSRDLAERRYSAVVLVDWSGADDREIVGALHRHTSPGARSFYGEVNFPPGFLDLLERHYRLSFVVRPFVVFEPVAPR